jgi:hypothetical protein
MSAELLEMMLPSILASKMPPTAPLAEQSTWMVTIERMLTEWFVEKKGQSPERNNMVLIFDVDPGGVLRMFPVIMDEPDDWADLLAQDRAIINSAFATMSANDDDKARAERTRAVRDRVLELYAAAADGRLVKNALLPEAINVTEMAASIPVFRMLPTILAGFMGAKDESEMTEDEKEEARLKQMAVLNKLMEHVKQAARHPWCRLEASAQVSGPDPVQLPAGVEQGAPFDEDVPAPPAYNDALANVAQMKVVGNDDLAHVPNASSVGYDDTAHHVHHADGIHTDTAPHHSVDNGEVSTTND